MLTGRVKWFDDIRGYGFIVCDDLPQDVMVHHKDIRDMPGHKTLIEGQEVRFLHTTGGKGLKALSVFTRPADDSAPPAGRESPAEDGAPKARFRPRPVIATGGNNGKG